MEQQDSVLDNNDTFKNLNYLSGGRQQAAEYRYKVLHECVYAHFVAIHSNCKSSVSQVNPALGKEHPLLK